MQITLVAVVPLYEAIIRYRAFQFSNNNLFIIYSILIVLLFINSKLYYLSQINSSIFLIKINLYLVEFKVR